MCDKSIPKSIVEKTLKIDWIRGWETALQRLVKRIHDTIIINPSMPHTTFVDNLIDESFQALETGSVGPEALNLLLEKLNRTFASTPQPYVLKRGQS